MERQIIIVEDDPLLRTALTLSLEDADYEVIAARTAEQAVCKLGLSKAASDISLSAVVADYHLDGNDNGISIIHDLEQVYGTGFRSVLITGDDIPHIVAEARSANLTLLHKPFRIEELLAVIDAPLGGVSISAPAAGQEDTGSPLK